MRQTDERKSAGRMCIVMGAVGLALVMVGTVLAQAMIAAVGGGCFGYFAAVYLVIIGAMPFSDPPVPTDSEPTKGSEG